MSTAFPPIVQNCRLFESVQVFALPENFQGLPQQTKEFQRIDGNKNLTLAVIDQSEDLLLRFQKSNNNHNNEDETMHVAGDSNNHHQNNITNGSNHETNLDLCLHRESDCFGFGQTNFIMKPENKPNLTLLQFVDKKDQNRFAKFILDYKQQKKQSTFNQRTDSESAMQYFQFYSYLSQQQNMMQDYIRTSTYQKAILSNSEDFKDKVVLDVGAGSGILSFFALQAGAKIIYAVEASSMAKHAQLLVQSNHSSSKIKVLAGKLEEIELPEPVDVIISEPMGYMLFNERMLETYLHAKKWLKPSGGKMFPTRGDLHVAPFTDAQLYLEQTNKASFWFSSDFHGVDLRALHSAATNEYFRQPIVDTFDMRICMAKSIRHVVDFQKADETDLHCISIPLEYVANQTAHIHGLAFWFDIAFIGSEHTIWLSTSPSQPLTHWYQVRCLLNSPLFVNKGQVIYGSCILRSNKRQSYDVDIELFIKELGTRSSNSLDLKNPYFRYTGASVQPPPGVNEISPSEQLWSTMTYDQQQASEHFSTITPSTEPMTIHPILTNSNSNNHTFQNVKVDHPPKRIQIQEPGIN